MNEFIRDRVNVEEKLASLVPLSAKERAAQIERIEKEAESKSSFKKWQLVRVCRPGALILATGLSEELPDDDPYKYFNSRIMGWDMFGRIEVATEYGDNPHRSDWCWTEDRITPRDDIDWVSTSNFKVGQEISYIWELSGFWEDESLGKKLRAVIKGPHIEVGDWVVLYEKPSGGWITRVLNEKQMLPR
jgi:hypothetical protein